MKLKTHNLSLYNQALIFAYEKGYRVDENGEVSSIVKKLKTCSDRGGYLFFSVRLNINGNSVVKNVKVHRLQAYQKYGFDVFKEGIDVRHKDGDKKNNSHENILIGTTLDNIMDRTPESRREHAIKASNKKRRFKDEEVVCIISDFKSGFSYNKLCEKYQTSKSTLSYLFNKSLYAKKNEVL